MHFKDIVQGNKGREVRVRHLISSRHQNYFGKDMIIFIGSPLIYVAKIHLILNPKDISGLSKVLYC